MLEYGVTDGLNRGHSEVLTVNTDFQRGQPLINTVGRPIYFPPAAYADREVVEIFAITSDVWLKAKTLPTAAQLVNIVATFVTLDGDRFIEDIPLVRLTLFNSRFFRNILWQPRRIDMQQSYIQTTGSVFRGNVSLELVYKT